MGRWPRSRFVPTKAPPTGSPIGFQRRQRFRIDTARIVLGLDDGRFGNCPLSIALREKGIRHH
jgi:hypothetical protein